MLLDAYRAGDRIVLWKRGARNYRQEHAYSVYFYVEALAEEDLVRLRVPFRKVRKKDFLGEWVSVLKIRSPSLSSFERFVRFLERKTCYRYSFFNADIPPEISFLYEGGLRPFQGGDHNLVVVRVDLATEDGYVNLDERITSLSLDGKMFSGDEKDMLVSFVTEFIRLDPDVIVMPYAYRRLPFLVERLAHHALSCPFHRWDDEPIIYKGGKSFWSYGSVQYRDFAIRLHGRFLVDSTTQIGGHCDVDSIVELSELTGCPFQSVASRSFGAAFQQGVVRSMVEECLLVPHKDKIVDNPVSMLDLIKADRYGHTFDPRIGFHTDVAEIDFSSMYPWIIYHHNVSAETILTDNGPFTAVPGVPVRISRSTLGIIPKVIKPIIDRRMYYKDHPTVLNKKRVIGLKWLLVTSYGYLRFREFKLGIASAHMSIGAYARETLLSTAHLAEEFGFKVIHGIIDSLYIHKRGLSENDVLRLCKEVEYKTRIPVSFEGVFKWIVFLPSINDGQRPVPARYFGALRSGDVKVRGIEARQRSAPALVKEFQMEALSVMARCSSQEEIISLVPGLARLLRAFAGRIPCADAQDLVCRLRVGRTSYKHSVPQKIIVERLQRKGVQVRAGMMVSFIFSSAGVVLPSEFKGNPDNAEYTRRLVRSLFVLLQVFGLSRVQVEEFVDVERQTLLVEFLRAPALVLAH